jgi:hypothetical protein
MFLFNDRVKLLAYRIFDPAKTTPTLDRATNGSSPKRETLRTQPGK